MGDRLSCIICDRRSSEHGDLFYHFSGCAKDRGNEDGAVFHHHASIETEDYFRKICERSDKEGYIVCGDTHQFTTVRAHPFINWDTLEMLLHAHSINHRLSKYTPAGHRVWSDDLYTIYDILSGFQPNNLHRDRQSSSGPSPTSTESTVTESTLQAVLYLPLAHRPHSQKAQ